MLSSVGHFLLFYLPIGHGPYPLRQGQGYCTATVILHTVGVLSDLQRVLFHNEQQKSSRVNKSNKLELVAILVAASVTVIIVMSTGIIVATGIPLSPPMPSLRTTKYFVPEVYNEQIHEWHRRPFLMMAEGGSLWGTSRDKMVREGRRLLGENKDIEGLTLSTVDDTRVLLSAKSGNIREGQAVFLSGSFLSKVFHGRDVDYTQEFQVWVHKKVGVDLKPERDFLVMRPDKPAEDHKQYVVYFARIRPYR